MADHRKGKRRSYSKAFKRRVVAETLEPGASATTSMKRRCSESVLKVRARGVSPASRDQVFDLLAITFEPAEGCAGTLILTLAGGAEVAVEVECLELTLADLTRPWAAKSGTAPGHGD